MFQMSMYAAHSVIDGLSTVAWWNLLDAFGNPDHQNHQSTCTLSTLQIADCPYCDVGSGEREHRERGGSNSIKEPL
jgi:hypothetical protein